MLKKCKECGTVHDTDDTICTTCGGELEEYVEPTSDKNKNAPDPWMYISTFFIPLFGILLSCIYVLKDDKKSGKSLICTVFFSLVMYGLILFLFGSNANWW